MLVKTLRVCCFIAATWFCLSFIGGFSDSQIEQHSIQHKVKEGETLYSIADQYFMKNQNGMCFNEFWYNLMADNANLTANRRYLQPGDVVTVNYYTVKNQ